MGGVPLTAPRTPWNHAITPQRRVSFARISLEDAKAVKRAFDVKLNDVVLAVVGGTLRRYLEANGGNPEDPLLAVCPVSVRTDEEKGDAGNRVSAMFTSLATDIDDPVERLQAIARATVGAKQEHNAVGRPTADRLGRVRRPPHLPPGVEAVLVDEAGRPPPPPSTTSSSPMCRGRRSPCIWPVRSWWPPTRWGRSWRVRGLNVTVLSYRYSIDFGFLVDRDLVTEVWDLAAHVSDTFAELMDAAGLEPTPDGETAEDSAPRVTDPVDLTEAATGTG